MLVITKNHIDRNKKTNKLMRSDGKLLCHYYIFFFISVKFSAHQKEELSSFQIDGEVLYFC